MEVFTVVEHRLDAPNQGDRRCCQFHLPFPIALFIQSIIAVGLTVQLLWYLCDVNAAESGVGVFGRATVVTLLICSFLSQKSVFCVNAEYDENKLIGNLVLYMVSLVSGFCLWLTLMQYSSAQAVLSYVSVEPIVLTSAMIVAVYVLRRLMTHYENCRTDQLDIYTSPLFPKMLVVFAVIEAICGVIFGFVCNFILGSDYEFWKRCGALLAIFVSAIINEVAIVFSKESGRALLAKTMGFFALLVSCQLTWWLSYYKERQLTLYGLGVGFLTLLFGVLYTVEMSLSTAQLRSHGENTPRFPVVVAKAKSGDSPGDNNEENSSDGTQSTEGKLGSRVLNRKCVIGFAIVMQIGLGFLPVVVLLSDYFLFPESLVPKTDAERMERWYLWAADFISASVLSEIILFQSKVNFWIVSIANGSFCMNFCLGCVITYQAIQPPSNFALIASLWSLYFVICHLDFVRLTRFSLELEEGQIRKRDSSHVTLFFASGIQSMVAIAAFLPATDFVYFPGKVFSILTFPSLTFIAEVVFYFGKKCRGPFLIAFGAFFLGTGYGQVVWYISVIIDDSQEFLGLTRPWLLAGGVIMGILAWLYVLRFLFIIITKWEKRD